MIKTTGPSGAIAEKAADAPAAVPADDASGPVFCLFEAEEEEDGAPSKDMDAPADVDDDDEEDDEEEDETDSLIASNFLFPLLLFLPSPLGAAAEELSPPTELALRGTAAAAEDDDEAEEAARPQARRTAAGRENASTRRAPSSRPMMGAPVGRWSVMGFLMTFRRVLFESAARTFNLCKSCTA